MTIQQGEIQDRSRTTSGRSLSDGKNPAVAPTHDQIAARAKTIWESKGCPPDQDQKNWREAEAELRKQAKVKP